MFAGDSKTNSHKGDDRYTGKNRRQENGLNFLD